MRTIIRSLSLLSFAFFGALYLAANAAAQNATIVKLVPANGPATVIINGQSTAATEKMSVPPQAEINTGAVDVYLEVVPGVVATIKPNSKVVVSTLSATQPQLDLRQGSVISQLDRKRLTAEGVHYGVKTARGVAAARGTSFTVSDTATGFTIATTADTVTFTNAAGFDVMIKAGQVTITPPGGTPGNAMSLADAVKSDPAVAGILTDAVSAISNVVANNLGSISADSATNIVAQVVAVAVAAVPSQATTFVDTAIRAVTTANASTAGTPDSMAIAAGAVTAAAVKAAPDQAAQIAGSAAAAVPTQAGVITAAAQAAAPESSAAILQEVSARTGQTTGAIQNSATQSSAQAKAAANAADDALSNVVAPPPAPNPTPSPVASTSPDSAPGTSIDPSQNVSSAGGQP
jgi:hypothetical protein